MKGSGESMGKATQLTVNFQGLSHTFRSLRACGRAFNMTATTISERLKKGWTLEEAVGLVLKTGECLYQCEKGN